jgi:NDP-mannose synthase
MSRRAIILAGGQGTRLRPYTVVLPKPLMPIGDQPVLELIVRQLALLGFDRITMAVNHQADIIKAYFGDGTKWGVNIDYSLETSPRGTMGPLRLARDLPENFLIMNGDILTDLNFAEFLECHVLEKRLFTISVTPRTQLVDFGVMKVSEDGRLIGFEEKPRINYLVSMGVYAASRAVLDYIPEGGHFGFDDLLARLEQSRVMVHARPFAGYWLDIGRPDDYMRAIDDYASLKEILLPRAVSQPAPNRH